MKKIIFLFHLVVLTLSSKGQVQPRLMLPIGHTNTVNSAAFSKDGKYVVTSSEDNTARIWDATNGKELENWNGHIFNNGFSTHAALYSASFSPNGKYVVDVSYLDSNQFQIIQIIDVDTGKEFFEFGGNKQGINSAVFNPQGKYVVTSSDDNTARIWDVLKGSEIQKFSGHNGRVTSASFSSDGYYVITSSYDSTARIWDTKNGKCILILKGHNGEVNSASFSSDGHYVITSSYDSTARIWDTKNGKCILILKSDDYLYSASFNYDGQYVLTSSYDTARIWDTKNGKCILILKGHNGEVKSATFSTDGKYVVTASDDCTAKILNTFSGQELQTLKGYSVEMKKAKFSKDGKLIVAISSENVAYVYDFYNGKKLQSFIGHKKGVSSAEFSSDGKYLITTSRDSTAKIWDVLTGKLLHNFEQQSPRPYSGEFSVDGKLIQLMSEDTFSDRVYELSTHRLIGSRLEDWHPTPQYFSADGKHVASHGSNHRAVIENIEEKGQVLYLYHSDDVTSVSFSPICANDSIGGKFVLTTGKDHKSILWLTSTGKKLYTRLQLKNGEWLIYDEDYHYDGSPGARDMLYFVCGLEVIELSQMKDALYVPDLAEKIMNGQAINYKKLSELDICGTLPLIDTVSKNDKGYHYKITPRKYPLERLELQVNKKNVITILPNKLSKMGNDFYLDLTEQEVSKHFISGQANLVKLIGVVKEGNTEITTRGVEITSDESSSKTTNPPNLYAVMVGINDYKDENLHLNFPSKDAISLGKSVEQSAKKLLGDDHVFVYNVNTDFKNKQVKVISTPEKEGVRKVLEEIGKKSKPEDIVMIFFAGHGVMQGATDKKFTFLTAEASKDNLVGISTNDLKSWLSPEGPNKILANKSILIFDACNSGQATKEIAVLARNDDESNRKRQVEDLKDKSGMFILAASAPNQSAYELPQYQQGLLTYCLLSTLKNDPNILDDNKYLNVQKWFLQTESLLKNTMESLGLTQNAQPYGTANIKIGLVDEGVKNNIQLAKEKPAVLCISAEDKTTEEDGLRLKDKLNAKLMEITSRGIDAPIIYIEKETSSANAIKLKYEVKSGKINCDVIFLKNQKKYNQSSVEGKEVDLDGMIDLIIGVVEKNIK